LKVPLKPFSFPSIKAKSGEFGVQTAYFLWFDTLPVEEIRSLVSSTSSTS